MLIDRTNSGNNGKWSVPINFYIGRVEVGAKWILRGNDRMKGADCDLISFRLDVWHTADGFFKFLAAEPIALAHGRSLTQGTCSGVAFFVPHGC